MSIAQDAYYSMPLSEPNQQLTFKDACLRQIEKYRLQHRAARYSDEEDCGGVAYIRKIVKPGDTVFDIGAHKAGYLYFFLQQLKGAGAVYAFEPQTTLFNYLGKLKKLFHWQQVTIEHAAVSDQTGSALLCVPYNGRRNSSPCATIIESKMLFDCQFREEVATISLDDYCSRRQLAPDFLKVDVEGNELPVFRGAGQLLRTRKPPILFECEARFVGEETVWETFRFLQQLGYTGHFIRRNTVLPIAAFSVSRHQDINSPAYCNNFIFE